MAKNFMNSVKLTRPNRSNFDLSHDVKLSCNMGQLVPIMCIDAVPGDKFNLSCESLLRFAPLTSPMMHRVDVTMHYFKVPKRLLWNNWENYITNTKVDDVLPAVPHIYVTETNYTPLCDYLGLPTPLAPNSEKVCALPFAAMFLIWWEYYRDQNLQNDPALIEALKDFRATDGDWDAFTNVLLPMRNRCWEHDYFTSALPFAQKGDPVTIPIAGTVTLDPTTDGTGVGRFKQTDDYDNGLNGAISGSPIPVDGALNNGTETGVYDPNGTLIVDNANTTINDLRRAYRLQEWLEKAARGGSRYIENILVQFGVKSSDARLNRPEYITGIKTPVTISEVLNTTGTVDAPQGDMAGHGVAVTGGQYGTCYCEEHCYIIGIMSVMPKTAYQQGIPKHFLKTESPFDHYWPPFANIGEQEILNKELYAYQGTTGNLPFGYTPRYAEYKFENNRVAGDFKTTLNNWHMARIFDTVPALNEQFVESDPTHRIFAVTDPSEQKMWCHVYNKVFASRLMPKYGTPTF